MASLLGPDKQRVVGTRPVRRLHRALESPRAEGHVRPDPRPAQAGDQHENIRVGVLPEGHAEDLARGGGRPDRTGPFGFYG